MRLLIGLFVVLAISSCNTETSRSGCETFATVADKTGLDGCQILFVMENDKFLEPIEWQAEQPALEEGKSYYINYEPVEAATICMAGQPVRITCITAAD